jgi:hypothetical protein
LFIKEHGEYAIIIVGDSWGLKSLSASELQRQVLPVDRSPSKIASKVVTVIVISAICIEKATFLVRYRQNASSDISNNLLIVRERNRISQYPRLSQIDCYFTVTDQHTNKCVLPQSCMSDAASNDDDEIQDGETEPTFQ